MTEDMEDDVSRAYLHKIELYVLVHEGSGLDDIQSMIDKLEDPKNYYTILAWNGKTADIDWHDDIDLNSIDVSRETCQKYFVGPFTPLGAR